MSDYVQTVDFSSKDLLASGDPNKLIKGSEFDAEFDAIAAAISSKYDSSDIASQNQAEAESSNTVIMTPLRVGQWADANAGIVGDLQGLSDPNADRLLFWDDSAGAAAFLSVSSNLSISGTTLDVGSNVALKNAPNTFLDDVSINGNAAISGTLTVGGTISGPGSGLTSLNASNLSSGTLADARLSSNVPLKNASNTFTGTTQTVTGGFARWLATDGTVAIDLRADSSNGRGEVGTTSAHPLRIKTNATERILISETGVITLNGVNVTDYARLSQPNTFAENPTVRRTATSAVYTCNFNDSVLSIFTASSDNSAYVGTTSAHPFRVITNNATRYEITTAGAHDFKGGAVLASTIAQSTSTTLVAGQVHAIDGNATLPNLAAGQWVTVINNGSSARTVTKHGSDTMYWTATGASVTSVTIPARGRASFVCADGTNVYASGNITGAS